MRVVSLALLCGPAAAAATSGVVHGVWPLELGTIGGATLRVLGSGLRFDDTVLVGGLECAALARPAHAELSELACRAPALADGEHDVVVRSRDGEQVRCDSASCWVRADTAHNAAGAVLGPLEGCAGDTLHVVSSGPWSVANAAGQFEISLGRHPVHMDHHLTRHRGPSSGSGEAGNSSDSGSGSGSSSEMHQLHVHIPVGLPAGVHELDIRLHALPRWANGEALGAAHGSVELPARHVVVRPKVVRVVAVVEARAGEAAAAWHAGTGNVTLRVFGSGFSLQAEDNDLTWRGQRCDVSHADFRVLEATCSAPGSSVPWAAGPPHSVRGVRMELDFAPGQPETVQQHREVHVSSELLWPVPHPAHPVRGFVQDGVFTARAAAGAELVAPASAFFRFAVQCPGTRCSTSLPATRTWLERGQHVPLQLELLHERHGHSVRVSVEMDGGEVGPLSALEVVPAAWFEQAGRASAAGDDAGALALDVNGLAAVVAWDGAVELLATGQLGNAHAPRAWPAALAGVDVAGAGAGGALRRLQQQPTGAAQALSTWLAAQGGCQRTTCVVPAGVSLVADADADVHSLIVRGSLRIDNAADGVTVRRLAAGFVVVESGGRLVVDGRTSAERSLVLYIKGNGAAHGKLGERALGTWHDTSSGLPGPELRVSGFQLQRTWSLLAATADRGAVTITLANAPAAMGWRVGDRIAIAPPGMPTVVRSTFFGPEEFVIGAMSGNTLTLGRGASLGQRYLGDAARRLQCEVINLGRNVIVTGDDFAALKGLHVVSAFGGVMHVTDARVEKCGRRGEMGRYCLHFHQMGDCGANCQFLRNAVEDGNQRGIVVHGTHRSTVQDNVLYKVRGAGLYIEDGNEMANLIKDNVNLCHASGALGEACKAPGTDNDLGDNTFQGGLWGLSVTNDVQGNRFINHENGLFTQVTAFPFGRGFAASKLCSVHSVFGAWAGNVQHSNWRFGFYLDSQWPRNIARSVASNGLVTNFESCNQFRVDGSDNGAFSVVADTVDWGNDFVGQYEGGDLQYLRHYSVNNLKGNYWKQTKSFAWQPEPGRPTAHIKDSTYAYFSDLFRLVEGYPPVGVNGMLGPGGLGPFVIDNTRFLGAFSDSAIGTNQQCSVGPGTGALCTPTYLLRGADLSGLSAATPGVQFGASSGKADTPHLSAAPGEALYQDYVSAASASASYLLATPGGVCARAADLGGASLGAKWGGGILCKRPLRRLQVWSGNQGPLALTGPGGAVFTMRWVAPCPGTGEECVNKQGYGAPVLAGDADGNAYEYSLTALDRAFRPSGAPPVTLEFSDNVLGMERLNLRLAGGALCTMSSKDDRVWIGPFGPSRAGRGACTNLDIVPAVPTPPPTSPAPAPTTAATATASPTVACGSGPFPASFNQCQARLDWMLINWSTAPSAAQYKANGVDGSRCSIQHFLSTVENWCPSCSCSASPTTASPTTPLPSKQPTTSLTNLPTDRPSTSPSNRPTTRPTTRPSQAPTTARPTPLPSAEPSQTPTRAPSSRPTPRPTTQPSQGPSSTPTSRPTTGAPSARPATPLPSVRPTSKPTSKPTNKPTQKPTNKPTPPSTAACINAPYPAAYPLCEARVQWLMLNWKTSRWSSIYIAGGVDGSKCSVVRFLATVERYCAPCVC